MEIANIQPFFEIMLGKLKNPNAAAARDEDGSHQIKNEFVVFIVNPDKARFAPPGQDPQKGFQYRYNMGSGSGRSQTWVGASEFCVVDLSAGPVKMGSLPSAMFEKRELGATFSARNFPSISRLLGDTVAGSQELKEKLKFNEQALILDIIRVIQSAVTQVFLPNIGFETNIQAEKVWINFFFS